MNPAPTRQRLKNFPTPKVADVIYTETFDATRRAFPEYGSAHPDATNYPDHILVHITQADEQGLVFNYHYAKDRTANQEDYNFSIEYPYGGAIDYPRITRTYILRRGENQLEPGSSDPGGSVQSGGTVKTSTSGNLLTSTGGVVYTSGGLAESIPPGILVAQWEKQLPPPLGSVYVEVTRIYDVIPGLEDPTNGSGLTQADGGYTVQRPIQDKNWVVLTWNLTLPRTAADTYRRDSFETCPVDGYTNLKLIDETIKASDENNQTSTITRIFAGNVTGVDSPSVPVITSERELPGVIPPDKFLLEKIVVKYTEQLLRPHSASLTVTTGMIPSTPTGYTLMAVQVNPVGVNSGNRAVVSVHYGTRQKLSGANWDNNLLDYVPYTVEVKTPAEVTALLGAQLANPSQYAGSEYTFTPINAYWTIVTKESPRTTVLGAATRSYYSTMPFSWPAVLKPRYISGTAPIQLWNVPLKDSDGVEMFYDYDIVRSWNGICKCRKDVYWTATPPNSNTIEAMAFMLPEAIDIDWPVLRMSIPATLHDTVTLSATTGTDHEKYDYVGFTKTIFETNYKDWPSEIVADFDIVPYKGGWRIEKVTVFSPPNPPPT